MRPTHTPRASERHLGANKPLNAGTKYTPPVSGTVAASASTSDARSITPRLSRNHCTPAPAMATEPSNAYAGVAVAPNCHATVVSKPCEDGTGAGPVLSSMKHPVPYVFFASPGAQRWPNVAACWSPSTPPMRVPASDPGTTTPNASGWAEGTTWGNASRGMPNFASVGWCHVSVCISMSMVRAALVTSVT